MWFWIFAFISVALIVWWIYTTWTDTIMLETWIGRSFMTIVALGAGFLLIVASWWGSMGLANWLTPDFKAGETTSTGLVAVQTKDTVEGRVAGSIFASYGYINGIRVISYVSKDDDGGIRVGYVRASASVVYEGDDKPEMKTHHWYKENGWFFPFGHTDGTETYTLHVPTGSVVDGYEVAP